MTCSCFIKPVRGAVQISEDTFPSRASFGLQLHKISQWQASEVERRDLHLRLGFSSLWDYAVRGLKYSEPAAHRRISTARALSAHPELRPLLPKRLVNLTTVSLIATALSPDTLADILKGIEGKSKREVEEFIGSYRPRTKILEKVTPVKVIQPAPSRAAGSSAPALRIPETPIVTEKRLSPAPRLEARTVPAEECPHIQMYKVQCALSEQGYRKLKEVESLLSHTATSLGAVVERLCDYYLKHESPLHKKSGRGVSKTMDANSRYIPQSLRNAVWKRDEGRCGYRGPDGRVCGSTHQVQIDHIEAFALGGESKLENLRLACSSHNRFLARQAFPGKGRWE